jgi:hypothetical protein
MRIKLRITQNDYLKVKKHLFPGDGLEAVAIALCGRRRGQSDHCLSIKKVVTIPYESCKVRRSDLVTWSSELLIPLLEEASRYDLAVLKIHSHPGGYPRFSQLDDHSDADLFNSVFGWTDSDFPHASVIMLPDGRMFGRGILRDGTFKPLHSILVPGDDLLFWTLDQNGELPSYAQRHAQLFGDGTTKRLHELAVAVIGCSGTGSPVVEQLVRLGVGRVVLVDPEYVELKNLNRILNSRIEDVYLRRPKVEALARAIAAMGLGTEVEIINSDLATPRAIRAVAECDVVFGCMDSIEGRHRLNRLAAYYVLPYFDIGVKLVADGKGGITEASGAVHYIRPDGSNLLDRKVYTLDELRAEGLRRTDKAAYHNELKAGYIHGVQEERPAVISINMQMASTAVNEFLARFHPYRLDENSNSSVVRVSFVHNDVIRQSEVNPSKIFFSSIGKGDVNPLLSMPELSETEVVA